MLALGLVRTAAFAEQNLQLVLELSWIAPSGPDKNGHGGAGTDPRHHQVQDDWLGHFSAGGYVCMGALVALGFSRAPPASEGVHGLLGNQQAQSVEQEAAMTVWSGVAGSPPCNARYVVASPGCSLQLYFHCCTCPALSSGGLTIRQALKHLKDTLSGI